MNFTLNSNENKNISSEERKIEFSNDRRTNISENRAEFRLSLRKEKMKGIGLFN